MKQLACPLSSAWMILHQSPELMAVMLTPIRYCSLPLNFITSEHVQEELL